MTLSPNSNHAIGEGNTLPNGTLRSRIARVWAYRKRVEFEAADQFDRLANGLKQLRADPNIFKLARRSAEDEVRHANLCRKIIEQADPGAPLSQPQLGVPLGPLHLDQRQRVLYACVSLSCITEALSTALLIEMQKQAEPTVVRNTVHSILQDEITHSRIGWAHLASEANRGDVSWISPYIPAMLRAAMREDVPSMNTPETESDDLSAWGILPLRKAKAIMLKTTNDVILPGLKAFGIGYDAP